MTERSIRSSVEVGVDPGLAFRIFTEELDCWWLQGPINFFDSSRAFYKRVEPGVGGRIVEVYDESSGDGLELARITTWEPGERLGWTSSIDDVEIEVCFEAAGDGRTRVNLRATLPENGADRGGTAWLRTTPVWFGRWVSKRERLPRSPLRLSSLAVAIYYARPATAARWLRDVYQLEPAGEIPEVDTNDDHTWIELHAGDPAVGSASVIVLPRKEVASSTEPTHSAWVFVDDLDAHFAHAKANGATLLGEIWQHGARAYDTTDLEGNRWTFAQAAPSMRVPTGAVATGEGP